MLIKQWDNAYNDTAHINSHLDKVYYSKESLDNMIVVGKTYNKGLNAKIDLGKRNSTLLSTQGKY